jgi:formate dehydrogenase subunit gamma
MTDGEQAFIDQVIALKKDMPGALMPILHGIQDAVGYIPSEAVARIATELNLSRAEVHGVITYYHHFRSAPAGRHVVQICRAESCQAMGSEQLWAHACLHLNSDGHSPTPDGDFTVEPVYCLGLCASSPSMAIDGKVHARINTDKFNRLVLEARSQA